jgi:hypothetical protein
MRSPSKLVIAERSPLGKYFEFVGGNVAYSTRWFRSCDSPRGLYRQTISCRDPMDFFVLMINDPLNKSAEQVV